MSLSKHKKFILAIAVQLAIIFTIIIFKVATLTSGTEVFLRIEPVDPRDMLRGDYVTFRYTDISNVNYFYASGEKIKNGDTVYVTLDNYGKYGRVDKIQKSKPQKEDILFIKGKVVSGAEESKATPPTDDLFWEPTRNDLHILYGIEEYFIPEGAGSRFNSWSRDGDVYAQVVIDKNGKAVIKKIYINDKPWP